MKRKKLLYLVMVAFISGCAAVRPVTDETIRNSSTAPNATEVKLEELKQFFKDPDAREIARGYDEKKGEGALLDAMAARGQEVWDKRGVNLPVGAALVYVLTTDEVAQEVAAPVFTRRCKSGDKYMCSTEKERTSEMISRKSCRKNNGSACLEIAFLLYRRGYPNEAMEFAQLSCTRNKNAGCRFNELLMQERATAEQKHDAALANRQAAIQQQQQQTFNFLQQMQIQNQINSVSANNNSNFFQDLSGFTGTRTKALTRKTNTCRTRPVYGMDGKLFHYEVECD